MSYLSIAQKLMICEDPDFAPQCRANAPTSVTFYYPQNRLKTPTGEQKTENFSVPYRVVLKRDRTTDVAEP